MWNRLVKPWAPARTTNGLSQVFSKRFATIRIHASKLGSAEKEGGLTSFKPKAHFNRANGVNVRKPNIKTKSTVLRTKGIASKYFTLNV